MTPLPPKGPRRPLYDFHDKYWALLKQGFTEAEAARMARNIPCIWGN